MLLSELWYRHHFAEGQTGFIQLWSCDYLHQPCKHDKIKKVRLLFVAHRVLLDPSNFNIYLFIYNLTLKINSVFNSCHFLRRSEGCVFCHVRVKREKEAKNRIVQRTMQWEMERDRERVTYILKSPFIDIYSHFVPVLCHTTDLMKMHLVFSSRLDTLELHSSCQSSAFVLFISGLHLSRRSRWMNGPAIVGSRERFQRLMNMSTTSRRQSAHHGTLHTEIVSLSAWYCLRLSVAIHSTWRDWLSQL